MKHIRIWACVSLLFVSTQIVFAQDQANEVRCSGSGTTCKANFVPKFATNGGSATVNDSIMSQSGTTIKVAGNETVTGVVSAGQGFSANTGPQIAVIGTTSTGGAGVFGFSGAPAGFGVEGQEFGSNGIGAAGSSNVFGKVATSIIGTAPIGVIGDSSSGYAVVAASDNSNSFLAENNSGADTAVIINLGGGAPLFAQGTTGSLFLDAAGNLTVSGVVRGAAKNFMIDHPLDPANKYLYHASVESSEMMNIYTGMTRLDLSGSAIVNLPDWFEAVNGRFRYQLTAIGAPAPNLHIAREISNNQFVIAGGQPGMKVSWEVTGVRHDAYAKAHPLHVTVDKPEQERGYYLHPELYDAPMEKSVAAHLAHIRQPANEK